ncbi:NADH-ubiquinone reductase complex 1 MLRQ subunit-domain-containing protein [Halteromyces radiatus]|uniref:NADH-ubiquinone reductase complex 1 MLRQ subunit-domain-containing protein n=1 Tax=Halteromyces radiatus TaxID=101107 RepID=UPI0022200413|nr:NADH-ubiquinone reductase complex 1 MLRQ subunit-domain-containing protein [Halteromyces radiatus]KAI8099005.1 NADH-ubiquinone reductase complex 1 MLRQ subunit-domain-containing protein [Halteromyces radiatus]
MGGVMNFIRQAKNKPEIFPLVGILGFAVSGAIFMSVHQARAPDVVWNHKDNKYPWQEIRDGEQVKLTTINQKYDSRWNRSHW